MEVRCFDFQPITFLPVGTARFLTDKRWPSVHLDRYLGSAWSSVYASSKPRIVVKFAKVAKKKKAELERQLGNEVAAYEKLVRLTRWVAPICYGEYKWYGGRALILSEEGPSLEDLEMDFMSLDLVERCDSPQLKENSTDLDVQSYPLWTAIFDPLGRYLSTGLSSTEHFAKRVVPPEDYRLCNLGHQSCLSRVGEL
jgi:hypothetical protein